MLVGHERFYEMHVDAKISGLLERRHSACNTLAMLLKKEVGYRIPAGGLYAAWQVVCAPKRHRGLEGNLRRYATMVAERSRTSSPNLKPGQTWTPAPVF